VKQFIRLTFRRHPVSDVDVCAPHPSSAPARQSESGATNDLLHPAGRVHEHFEVVTREPPRSLFAGRVEKRRGRIDVGGMLNPSLEELKRQRADPRTDIEDG
jgi:hypothetical protein